MLETKQTYRRVSRGIIQLVAGTYDTEGNLLAEELQPQQPLYWPWGLSAEELVRLKNQELGEK